MNGLLAQNVKDGRYRTNMTDWRAPARKIMLTEARGEDLPGAFYSPGWGYGVPLTLRHGTGTFHKNIPGFPEMSFGAKVGVNVSATFLDGHADLIDEDFAYDKIHAEPGTR
jgi:hypothetical protein